MKAIFNHFNSLGGLYNVSQENLLDTRIFNDEIKLIEEYLKRDIPKLLWNIRKNSEPKPLSEGFSEENDRKNQAPMPNEGDMSECPTLSPFYRIRRAIQAQASASASA